MIYLNRDVELNRDKKYIQFSIRIYNFENNIYYNYLYYIDTLNAQITHLRHFFNLFYVINPRHDVSLRDAILTKNDHHIHIYIRFHMELEKCKIL